MSLYKGEVHDLHKATCTRPLRIMSFPVDDGGCGWQRIRLPFEFLKRFTPHDCHIIDHQKDDMVAIFKAMQQADALVLRPGADMGFELMKKIPEMRDLTAKVIMDIDDNTEIISPYNYHYEHYGTEEFYDNNSKMWVWKDGVAGFDLQANRARVKSFIEGLKKVDMITVTTQKLADYAKQYNQNVAVLPNCINLERWWPLPLLPNKQLRIGWSGGVSHYEDWYSISKPLNQLLRKYQFTLVMIGADFKGVIDKDLQHLVELTDWVPFKGHSYRMMCNALDIAIIPLADLPFNHYKSSLKWYEMSAMAVPSVVANILPYSEDITDGHTALGYTTENQFYKALETLIKNKALRHKIGGQARNWVEANRDIKKEVGRWVEAYSNLCYPTNSQTQATSK